MAVEQEKTLPTSAVSIQGKQASRTVRSQRRKAVPPSRAAPKASRAALPLLLERQNLYTRCFILRFQQARSSNPFPGSSPRLPAASRRAAPLSRPGQAEGRQDPSGLHTDRSDLSPNPARGRREGPPGAKSRPGPDGAPDPAAATHEACAPRRDSICRCFCCWRLVRAGSGAADEEAPPPLPRGNSQFMAAPRPDGRPDTGGTSARPPRAHAHLAATSSPPTSAAARQSRHRRAPLRQRGRAGRGGSGAEPTAIGGPASGSAGGRRRGGWGDGGKGREVARGDDVMALCGGRCALCVLRAHSRLRGGGGRGGLAGPGPAPPRPSAWVRGGWQRRGAAPRRSLPEPRPARPRPEDAVGLRLRGGPGAEEASGSPRGLLGVRRSRGGGGAAGRAGAEGVVAFCCGERAWRLLGVRGRPRLPGDASGRAAGPCPCASRGARYRARDQVGSLRAPEIEKRHLCSVRRPDRPPVGTRRLSDAAERWEALCRFALCHAQPWSPKERVPLTRLCARVSFWFAVLLAGGPGFLHQVQLPAERWGFYFGWETHVTETHVVLVALLWRVKLIPALKASFPDNWQMKT